MCHLKYSLGLIFLCMSTGSFVKGNLRGDEYFPNGLSQIDPKSTESDFSNSLDMSIIMKHMGEMAYVMEDRFFSLLEELTDPSKHTLPDGYKYDEHDYITVIEGTPLKYSSYTNIPNNHGTLSMNVPHQIGNINTGVSFDPGILQSPASNYLHDAGNSQLNSQLNFIGPSIQSNLLPNHFNQGAVNHLPNYPNNYNVVHSQRTTPQPIYPHVQIPPKHLQNLNHLLVHDPYNGSVLVQPNQQLLYPTIINDNNLNSYTYHKNGQQNPPFNVKQINLVKTKPQIFETDYINEVNVQGIITPRKKDAEITNPNLWNRKLLSFH